jgi:endoglucanase
VLSLTLLISTVLVRFLWLRGRQDRGHQPGRALQLQCGSTRSEGGWDAYVAEFIQKDGLVIDYKASGITTSEGRACAMLRAVWVGDQTSFDKTFLWAKNNLNSGIRNDSLWAWKWGQDTDKQWRVLDKAFATDADQDAALALILASIAWKNRSYAEHAHLMLRDLWSQATVEAGGHRYLLAGDSLCQRNVCRINPSYYAPYAYRIFGNFDKSRPWNSLVDSSHNVSNRVRFC